MSCILLDLFLSLAHLLYKKISIRYFPPFAINKQVFVDNHLEISFL